jgi:hypothetical protein
VPMLARRYQATSIDIQRHTDRHKSLPSELPYFKSQPSLIDDLADYVLPSATSERLPSKEWATSPTFSSPSISVTSSPTTGHALPIVPEATSTAGVITNTLPKSATETVGSQLPLRQLVTSNERPAKSPQQDGKDMNLPTIYVGDSSSRWTSSASAEHTPSSLSVYATTIHTLRSPSSFVDVTVFTDNEPVRRPSSQRPSQRMSKRMSQASSGRSFGAAPSPTIANVAETPTAANTSEEATIHQETVSSSAPPLPSPRIVTKDASQPSPADPTETPKELDDDDVALSVLQQRLRSHRLIKTMAENLVRQEPATDAAPQTLDTEKPILSSPVWSEQPHSMPTQDLQVEIPSTIPSIPIPVEASSVHSTGSQNGDGEKKPMSAQAKRRAAHARRMQLAFGDESNV